MAHLNVNKKNIIFKEIQNNLLKVQVQKNSTRESAKSNRHSTCYAFPSCKFSTTKRKQKKWYLVLSSMNHQSDPGQQ
jgi:hypothetical protein